MIDMVRIGKVRRPSDHFEQPCLIQISSNWNSNKCDRSINYRTPQKSSIFYPKSCRSIIYFLFDRGLGYFHIKVFPQKLLNGLILFNWLTQKVIIPYKYWTKNLPEEREISNCLLNNWHIDIFDQSIKWANSSTFSFINHRNKLKFFVTFVSPCCLSSHKVLV